MWSARDIVVAVAVADAEGSGSRVAQSASVVVVVVAAGSGAAQAVVGLGGRSNGGGLRSKRRAGGGWNTGAFACGGGSSRSASGPASSPYASYAARNRNAFSSFSSSNPTPRSSRAVTLSALRCDTGSPRASHASFDDKNPEPSGLAPSLVLGLFSLRLWSAPKPAIRSAALADEGRRTTLIAPRRCDDALPTAVLRTLPTSRAHPLRALHDGHERCAMCAVASRPRRFGVLGAFLLFPFPPLAVFRVSVQSTRNLGTGL